MLDPQQYIFDIGVYKSLNFAQVQELGYEKLEILQPNGGDLWDEFNRLKNEYFIKSTDLPWELLVNERQNIIDKVKEYMDRNPIDKFIEINIINIIKGSIDKFNEMAKKANVPEELLILRDRWQGAELDYGVKLTNRAGTVKTGNQIKAETYSKCFYPSYQLLIDWNGDIFLCPQDWQRRRPMGNMMQESIFSIWTGKIMTKYRKNLLKGNRCDSPCKECNAEGTLLGYKHAKKWIEIY